MIDGWPRGLPYALRRRGHAFPALCPARAASVRVLLGPRPSLHRLRCRSPGIGPGGALLPYRGRFFTGRNASASPDAPKLKFRIHFPPAVSRANQWFPSSGARILETRETTEPAACCPAATESPG